MPASSREMDLARERLRNQRLAGVAAATPEEVVGWMGAVQAQDFAGARWAIGQRTRRCTDADVEQAYAEGRILRTHVLRPTWHLVLPADIRWMLALTAPRVRAASAYYERRLGLDERLFARSGEVISAALVGGKALTRERLTRALAAARLPATGPHVGHYLMRAELDALVTSGPREGKQLTYALLDERAPRVRALARDEALAALAGRYFASHGPALPHDFAWWSGLTIADARRAIDAARPRLSSIAGGGKTYWLLPARAPARRDPPRVHLLPNYDELLVGYQHRAAAEGPALAGKRGARMEMIANHVVVVDGRVVGTWRRVAGKGAMIVEMGIADRLGAAEREALRAAVARFGHFLGVSVKPTARPGGRMGAA